MQDDDTQTGHRSLEEECKTIKSENRKIREQLKLQVQERKLLLKKIRYVGTSM